MGRIEEELDGEIGWVLGSSALKGKAGKGLAIWLPSSFARHFGAYLC